MASIDYQAVRSLVRMADVLEWIGFTPIIRRGSQLRGACPLPGCPSRSHRTFSVHLEKQVFHCFACRTHGNQLDLWAAVYQQSIYNAAANLCQRANITVPTNAISITKTASSNTSNVPPCNQHAGPH